MALSLENIRRARDAGYDDDQILESIERRDKDFGGRIKKAREAGYDTATIMSSIENRLNQTLEAEVETSEPVLQTEDQLPQEEQSSLSGTQDQVDPSPLSASESDQGTPAKTLVNTLQPSDEEVKGFWDQAKDWIMQEPGEDAYEKMIRPRDISPEELKKMSVQERMQYAQELNRHMEYMRSKGSTKGFLSGVTFGLSEKIPALKPQEGENAVLFGEFLGSILPIEGMAKIIGWPLLKLAGMSPKYKAGLEALARITGMGITGATYEGIKEGIKKEELPSPEDLIKYGAEWAAFETVLQGLGYTARFVNALRKSKGNTVDKVNSVIKKVNLQESNPEVLKKEIDTAINEVFPERKSLTKEGVESSKKTLFEKIDQLPEGNKKKLAKKAADRQQLRTPEQLENFLQEYDTIYPGIQGKTAKDRNRKFLNKYSESNVEKRKFKMSEGEGKNVPTPKPSEEDKLKQAVVDLRRAKGENDKEAVKAAQKRIDIQKEKVERQKIQEQRKEINEKKKIEKQKVQKFEEKIETKQTKNIQKNIDSINEQIKKAESKGKTSTVKVLQKNLSIQKKKLKEAKDAARYSVPQNAKEVNTTQPTLVAENPEGMNNPNVVQAVSDQPVETLSKGMYFPESRYTNAVKKTKKGIRGAVKFVLDKTGQRVLKANPESSLYKKGWESIKEYVGERNVRRFKNYKKWDEAIVKNKNISKQDREDMIFYRERTGNPFIKGDTFEDLEKRISPEAKKVVDTVVDTHMKEALEAMNDAPFIKQKVTPRKEVEDIYIRHMYAGKVDSKKVDAAYEAVQKRFKTDNPFANKRTYLTFNEALQKAGLVPKYRDITQFLAAQDAIMTRVMSNNKLVHDLRNIEAEVGTKFIVRSENKGLYEQAKKDGWVPFQDAYMRSYVVGKNKKGKLKWAVTEAPALVHPDMASSLQGVFSKEAYKPDNAVLRLYDQFTSTLNKLHVGGSLFHFNALGESLTAKGGFLTSTARTPEWWRQGTKLMNDIPYMEDAIKHGVTIHLPTSTELHQIDTFYKDFLRTLQASPNSPLRGIGNLADMNGPLSRMHKFLFTEWQPRMKVVQYENYVNRMLKHFEKKGVHPNEQLLKEIKEQAAGAVNDQFGGQNWELIPFFNDPKNRKNLQRMIAFPDWTVSAIREISQAVASESPIRRRLGQRYIAEYLLGLGFGTQLLSYGFTGLENGPDGKIRWNGKKAHSTFENEDPKRRGFFDIQMPDIYFTIAGQKINMGRDENGRQYFVHAGKKFKEIERYFHSPVSALFSKSTPLVQDAMKFTMDHTPSEEGIFPVRGAYVEGEFRPWDGSRKWTKDRAVSVAKEITSSSLPYSVQTAVSDFFDSKEQWIQAIARTGFKFLGSGGGALSVGKGVSLRSSEPYWEQAFRIENRAEREESLKALRVLLKGYGYKDRQIKSIESKIRRRVEGKPERR